MSATSEGNGRVVLVTAAARGLGLAVARELAARGDRVHVAWRSSSAEVSALEAEFKGRVHRADMTLEADAQRLVASVLARDGRLDVLVHPVGEYQSGPLERASRIDFERLSTSNVATSLLVMNAARAALRESRGAALFFGVSGLDALRGRRDTALYAAVKSALLVLVRSWALEEAPHGVRVNALSPGIVPHAHAAADTFALADRARIPLGRAGTPADVASVAAFLCSDAASYITGADVPVSGGWQL